MVGQDNVELIVTASDGVQFEGVLAGMDEMSDLAVVKVVGERAWKSVHLSEKSELR